MARLYFLFKAVGFEVGAFSDLAHKGLMDARVSTIIIVGISTNALLSK
ncbi:hypothetical protein [Synechococcus sp. MIT S1220]